MEIGMIGLGKMGANMTTRLVAGGHRVVAFDLDEEAVHRAVEGGADGANTLDEVLEKLSAPRAIWVMLPAGKPTESTINTLSELLLPGDVILDGGNSYYKDSQRRAEELKKLEIDFVDVGTSGGIWGLSEGYSMMVGGEASVIERLRPIFETLAPAAEQGWGHVGPVGSGHFVKMIHNGIEYGMMQAYAEGFELLEAKREFNLYLPQIAEIWRYGSVVRSWLLDLTAAALKDNPTMDGIAAYVPDSGEGRWTVMEGIDLDLSIPIITLSLQRRFRSREEAPFGDKLLSAMRNQFGGHAIKQAD